MAKVDDTPENERICLNGNCSTCPSYPGGAAEALYCARGRSKCELDKKGCNCPECPIWIDNGLAGMYYCVKGSAG